MRMAKAMSAPTLDAQSRNGRQAPSAFFSLPLAGGLLVAATGLLFVLSLWLTDGAPLRAPVTAQSDRALTQTAERN